MSGSPWDLYSDTRSRFIDLVRDLDDSEASIVVPLCPAWSVADVLAHVVGLNADLCGGMRDGLGAEENTARQVSSRQGRSIDDVCDEWLSYDQPMSEIAGRLPDLAVRLGGDLIVHLQDVQHALGRPIVRDDEATAVAARRYVDVLHERARAADLAVTVELIGIGTVPGGDGDLALATSPFDFLRSITARRSRRQVEGLHWTGDPTVLLDTAWSPYGELGDEDIIELAR